MQQIQDSNLIAALNFSSFCVQQVCDPIMIRVIVSLLSVTIFQLTQ